MRVSRSATQLAPANGFTGTHGALVINGASRVMAGFSPRSSPVLPISGDAPYSMMPGRLHSYRVADREMGGGIADTAHQIRPGATAASNCGLALCHGAVRIIRTGKVGDKAQAGLRAHGLQAGHSPRAMPAGGNPGDSFRYLLSARSSAPRPSPASPAAAGSATPAQSPWRHNGPGLPARAHPATAPPAGRARLTERPGLLNTRHSEFTGLVRQGTGQRQHAMAIAVGFDHSHGPCVAGRDCGPVDN